VHALLDPVDLLAQLDVSLTDQRLAQIA